MNKKYNLVIFDLDGTVYDSYLSITKSFQHTLHKMCGIVQPDLEAFRDYIGPPLVDTLASYGLEGSELKTALVTYRTFYMTTMDDTVLYDGMPDLLNSLKSAGIHLAIASSKAEWAISRIFERDGLLDMFEFVAALQEGQNENKSQAIARVLQHFKPEGDAVLSAAMVGDRMFDAVGARDNNIDFIAAGYGPGHRAEFDPYPLAFYAETVDDIKHYLLG